MGPKEHVVYEGGDHMLALVGDAAGIAPGPSRSHDAVELAPVMPDEVEGLAVFVLLVRIRQGKGKGGNRIDFLPFP